MVDFGKVLSFRKQKYLLFDFETFSEAKLKAVGAYEYSRHPSTDIICLSFAIGTLEDFKARQFRVRTWSPFIKSEANHKNFLLFEKYILDRRNLLVAHNAFFDMMILKNVFGRRQPVPNKYNWDRVRCSMAVCQVSALPRSIEDAAIVLKLKEGKDKEGNRLIKKWCKPRKPTIKNPALRMMDMLGESEQADAEFARILRYCESDVRVMADIFTRLPQLTEKEQELWQMTQEVNERGYCVDRPLVRTILDLIKIESGFLDRRLFRLTSGGVESATKTERLRQWVCDSGYEIPNMQAKTIAAALKSDETPPDIKKVLRIRAERSMASTAKYKRFESVSRSDGRARGGMLHYAAHTGRWGGQLVNPHNFPRGTIKNAPQAAEIVAEGDRDLIKLIYGKPMAVYSSCLRPCIIPTEGYILDVADYSQIEVRVLFWMARHTKGLEILRDKTRDVYIEQAKDIYGVPVESITPDQRFIGKETVLGCGYMMGHKRFRAAQKDKGREISERFSKHIVETYRRTNRPVVNLWYDMERAAIAAVLSPGRVFDAGRCRFKVEGEFLYCKLPSGRKLAYYQPTIRYDLVFGEKKHVLYYWQIDTKTKKRKYAGTYGGKLVENACQAIARDFMAEAKLRIHKSKTWKLILSIHDELVAERKIMSNKGFPEYRRLVKEIPTWAEGCPIEAEGWTGMRYRK